MDMKQKIMAGIVMAACTWASAKNITSYNELVTSLRAGTPVNMVVDVEKCHFANDEVDTWEQKTLGARFDQIYERVGEEIEHGKKMRLVATAHHDFVGRESAHLMRTVYRVFEDGTTEIISQEIDPVSYKVLKNTFLFCRLSADSDAGVSLLTTDK